VYTTCVLIGVLRFFNNNSYLSTKKGFNGLR